MIKIPDFSIPKNFGIATFVFVTVVALIVIRHILYALIAGAVIGAIAYVARGVYIRWFGVDNNDYSKMTWSMNGSQNSGSEESMFQSRPRL
ncbi:MAG: hypothetical protein KGH94_00110 [Candidatus Micrarchaeota archaeon]|nr:hypothetical protein [Candidatus Micrarchaeota archaeon]